MGEPNERCTPIHQDCRFFNDTACANNNWASYGKNCRFGMNNCAFEGESFEETRRDFAGLLPDPIVMSPLSSTSWQTTALEWMVNLSRLERVTYKFRDDTH